MNLRPLLAIATLGATSGCFLFQTASKDPALNEDEGSGYVFPESFDLVSGTPLGSIAGRVTTTTGKAVPGARVELSNGLSVFTSESGDFQFEGLAPADGLVLSVTESHFTSVYQKVSVQGWETSTVELQVRPVGRVFKFDNEVGGVFTDGPLSLSVPPYAFADADGNVVSGQVRLSVTTGDIRETGADGAPGNFLGIDAVGEEVPLVSFGFFEVRAEVGNDEVNVADGQFVDVRFDLPAEDELPTAQVGIAGDSMPFWWWNPADAIWEHVEDLPIVENEDGTRYATAALPHFSTWNYDYAFSATCVDVTVLDIVRNPISGANVNFVGSDFSFSWSATTNSSGRATIIGMPGGRGTLTSSVSVDHEYYPDVRSITLGSGSGSPCPVQETVVLPVCFLGGDLWAMVSNTPIRDDSGAIVRYRVPAGGAIFYKPNGELEACEHPLDTIDPGSWIEMDPDTSHDYFGTPDIDPVDAGDIIRVFDDTVALDFSPVVNGSGDISYGVVVDEYEPDVIGDLLDDGSSLSIRVEGDTAGLAGFQLDGAFSLATTPTRDDPAINLEIDDDRDWSTGIQPQDNPNGLLITVPTRDGGILVGKFADNVSPTIPNWVLREMRTDEVQNIQISRTDSSYHRLPNGYYMRAETLNTSNVVVTVKAD
jgi:hypothetical protein